MTNTSTDYSPATAVSNPNLPQATDTSPFAVSNDHSSGVAPALPVTIGGQISNAGQGTLSFDSSSSGVSSVTLEDGWTGTDLQAQINSLTWTAEDVLQNGDLNDYHDEQFIVVTNPTYIHYNEETHRLPDGWSIVKDAVDDLDNDHTTHPNHGTYELVSHSSGYGSTWGVRVEADWGSSFDHTPNDEIYMRQMVSLPWREVYSADISFRYYVDASNSDLADQVHLFIRLAGSTVKFHVFETGDTTDTWLTASTTILAASMAGLSTYVAAFDIGIASDLSGQTLSLSAQAWIDEVQVDFTVRPFPEQIDLKADGTLVWGSNTDSVYPFVPDDANRDCYDDNTNGLDLDGYPWGGFGGELDTGIWHNTELNPQGLFETGMQFPLDIPQSAIITSAFLEVEAVASSGTPITGMRVHVAAEDNVSAFTEGLPHIEDRYNWVEATIPWDLNSWVISPTIRYQSPEIGPLVQKVISRPGWSEGNYILLMTSLMHTDYYQRWNSLKGTAGYDGNEVPRLFVEYIIPEPSDTVFFFDFQKDITVDHNDVVSDLTDFPVLIDITDSDLASNVLSNGNDISFTIGGTTVAHEIELFDKVTGHLVAWVKVPSLSSTTNTTITMLYGCPNVPARNSDNVWSDYAVVQHLNDDPSGIQYDSTGNNHDGTSYGGLNSSNLIIGQIGQAVSFDGVDDVISLGQVYTDDWTDFTMSVWVYQSITDDNRCFSKSLTTTPTDHIMATRVAGNYLTTRLRTDGTGGTGNSYDSNTTVSLGAWHYVSWSWSSTRGSVIAYLDGNPVIEMTHNGDTVFDSDALLVIGNNDLTNDRFWNGFIDEARLTTMVRSEAWVDTEYTNQANPSGFYTVGAESKTVDTWTDASEPSIYFTTSSPSTVTMEVNIVMDVGGEAQTMGTDFTPGVDYYIETGSDIVNWTAKVMVSPPAGATSFGFTVDYPRAEWKATKVLNPLNQPKTLNQDWWYRGGTLTLNASSIDFWGVWTLKFISWNFIDDVQINSPAFNVGEQAQFTMTTPTVLGAYVGLDLVKPDGNLWYSASDETLTDPAHKFPSFRYRKVITIPSAEIYGTVNDYPVLIQFEDTDLHDTSKVRSDASDILFASGDTILDHEIEEFIQDYPVNTALLVAWVKMNLTSGVDNYVTMYYGSPVVDHLENPAGVWSNDFEAVWHLGESAASGSTHYDSSGNGYDGSRNGNSQSFARAGYGQVFDGIGEYIAIDETLTPENDILVTGWFRLPSTHSSSSPNTQVIMEKYIDINHDMAIALVGIDYDNYPVANGSLVFKMESSPNSAVYKWTQTTTWVQNQWYFIACYADEDNPSNNKIWVNMNWDTAAGQVGSTNQANVSYVEEWRLGGGDYDSGHEGSGYFGGQLDEFRVSNSLRSDGWLRNEVRNQYNTDSFLNPGTEQERTSPDHTFAKWITSDAPVGQWTAVLHYNDTGTFVTSRTGLFELTFIVRHNTDLTLTKPTDAVGDRLSVKTAGDALIIEYELIDTDVGGNPGVSGAEVTMNWTTPSSITLVDYGSGLYGTVLDTSDLGTNKQWLINVNSYHQYYNNATEYFNVDLYHATTLSAAGGSTTPADFIFNTTVTYIDTFTGSPILGATITETGGATFSYSDDNNDGTYDISIPTTSLSLGDQQFTFDATVPSGYLQVAQVDVEFTLRAHYTTVSVSGDMTTPHGENTQATIFLLDLDTGQAIDIPEVDTLTFNYTGGYLDDTYGSYSVSLTTFDWDVGTETATLTITMSDSRLYSNPGQYMFSIQIMPHKTSLTVTGVTTEPYGNQTSLTIILTDLEDGNPVPIGSVSTIQLQYSEAPGSTDFFTYGITLDTSGWQVGTHTITVVVTMIGTVFSAPTNYQFDITIRSLTTVMYHGPSTLNFTIGTDFSIDLQLNVSEGGQYYGDPITGRDAGEFSVPGYTEFIDTSQNANGIYTLSIGAGPFTGGLYEIIVYFTSADNRYADTFLVIQFHYREIISFLTSPNYPQVTTPFGLDVEITLEFADADFGTGIEGATIDSPTNNSMLYNIVDETGGVYSVWINVSGLPQGTHYIYLRADKSGYDPYTLEFRLVIREAFTTATPDVGALDIPIGNSPFFYVDYVDIDRLLPIDNVTADTLVTSDWGNFSVEYVSGQYKITFHTSYLDTIAQNQVYTFTFSKNNYQTAHFTITVTIRTHNTEFRIVSSIEPTSTTGTFSIFVYYGDLDNTIGINSSDVVFSVSNVSGPVSSSYDYDLDLGFYIIQVSASQFGLGLQAFTVYADWTGAVDIYQDKSFITSANVVGKESTLTLLIGSAPTPYNEDMSYTFFYSDLFSGDGIHNLTGNVFVYISFQGESVNPSDVFITDFSLTEEGKYSIDFNAGIFSRTGLIYMNVFVNWSKGVSPFYANRTDVISVRILPRETLLSFTPPQPTSFNENATITLTFEDITGGSSSYITGLTKQEISLNISFSYEEDIGIYSISFNTSQFGSLGSKDILIDITWVGSPFYANRTGRITSINVIARTTILEYLTPTPTQYGDQVIFNVTWKDVAGTGEVPITDATLVLLEELTPIDTGEYSYFEISPGTYQVTLNTTYSMGPGDSTLRVEISAGEFYYTDKAIGRPFSILVRATIVAANPVADVPYNSSIIIIISYLDLFTGQPIANDEAHGYPVTVEIMSPSGMTFTATWRALEGNYLLNITWNPSWDSIIYGPNTIHAFSIRMSYAPQAPYYEENIESATFWVRIRESTISLDTEPETTPYLDDVTFTIFYSDDVDDSGISGATITVLNNSLPLIENTHYTLTEDSPGYYTIVVNSTALGDYGSHSLEIQASWTGAPYHESVSRDVSILTRQRETNVEITVPPSQTRYLDDVTFTLLYIDTDADAPITVITTANIHLFWENGTEILSGFSINQVVSSFEVTISSTALTNIPISGMTLNVVVDWNDSTAPFYKDDTTSVKVTITGRYMTADTSQIDRTPKGDTLTITITLTDIDNGNPVIGANVLFDSPNGTGLVETIHYDISEAAGVWTIDVYTNQLSGFGIFIFEVDVQWNPSDDPFYQNLNQFTLSGLIDHVRTSLQASVPSPSSVQFTEELYILITFRDLDHLVGIDGVDTGYIESRIVYFVSRDVPSGLSVTELGGGIYNVSLNTASLSVEDIYSLEISLTWLDYAPAIVTTQFSVVAINTALIPVETLITLNWTETATIQVDYQDLLHDITITGVVDVSWSIGGTFGAFLTEIGSTGRYESTIDTTPIGADTVIITITASEASYTTQIATVTLVILTLPSDVVLTTPAAGYLEEGRGNPVFVSVKLNDTTWNTWINNIYVTRVFITLLGEEIDMSWESLYDGGSWVGTISGPSTTIDPGPYDVRITARFDNYQIGTDQFKLLIKQTETQLTVLNAVENQVDAVFSEMVIFTLNFTEGPTGASIGAGTVWWNEADFNNLTLYFSHMGGGIWELNFNTSLGFYGTWGLTFRAIPDDPILAPISTTLTLTIKKIPTEVISPAVTTEVEWGWAGNITFFYNDTWFDRGISNATVLYDYGTFTGLHAHDLGNGYYLVFINTTYLTSNAQHRIIVDLQKSNFEERTSGTNIFVKLRSTELVVSVDDERTFQNTEDVRNLQVPMGDTANILFFFNDTSSIGGLFGGLDFATVQASFAATDYFPGSRNVTASISRIGDGWYSFEFDTNDLNLYFYNNFEKIIQSGQFFLTVRMEYLNRAPQEETVRITIIEVPVIIQYTGETVFSILHLDEITIQFTLYDTWHNTGVEGAQVQFSGGNSAVVVEGSNRSLSNGVYEVTIRVVGTAGDNIIRLQLVSDFVEEIELQITVTANPNETDILIGQVTQIGLPISLLVITLLGMYVRVWSVPKRIRQINGQLKTLRKGKVPKPIGDVKSRQQLTAELFNDTFEELKITRTAAQMPDDAIPIEVPEMGELLMQLAILTNLSAEELDDFQADIAKMKISEQAAFVKEVIMQEAIRAARRDGRTVDETIALVEQQAIRRLGGEEEVVPVEEVKTEDTETVFLEEEKKVTETPEDEVSPVKKEEFEEVTETTSEKMSMYELEELRRDLERRGVPPHEIDTIIEQAKDLPRELVDELVKSLEGKKD